MFVFGTPTHHQNGPHWMLNAMFHKAGYRNILSVRVISNL